ncbi:fumarylacetoacetate hydrolase, partial [Pseudomonas sp. SIMBA_059]
MTDDRSNTHQPLPLSFDASVFDSGSWVGRVWLPEQGPAVVRVKAGAVYDISSHVAT